MSDPSNSIDESIVPIPVLSSQFTVQSPVQSSGIQSSGIQSSQLRVGDLSRFEQFAKQKELNPGTAEQLRSVLSSCDVVVLCDDSDSMDQAIAEEGTDPFAQKRSTRWKELKKLAASIIEFVTAVNPNGLDIRFLNREGRNNVNSLIGLQSLFNAPPKGETPLIGALNHIYKEKSQSERLLIVVITDGEPTDGTRDDLYNILMRITSRGNIHISFAECTDNTEDMEYLDAWDGCIRNFDNTDDYREEVQRVKSAQGQSFKFDYTDYVIKILLATFIRWYFNLDQVKVYDPRGNVNISPPNNYGMNYQFQPQQSLQYQVPTPVAVAVPVYTPYPVYQEPPCSSCNSPPPRQNKPDCSLF